LQLDQIGFFLKFLFIHFDTAKYSILQDLRTDVQ